MMASALQVQAQYSDQHSTYRKYFVGTTLFTIANAVRDNNPPKMVYLNIGYRMTRRDVVSLECKTWRYA